jgi:hypothetical protein
MRRFGKYARQGLVALVIGTIGCVAGSVITDMKLADTIGRYSAENRELRNQLFTANERVLEHGRQLEEVAQAAATLAEEVRIIVRRSRDRLGEETAIVIK